jgi:glycosyltransferase involved in cell wall biosynthesis
MRIVHLTTVHPARDTRILVREVASLARAYDQSTDEVTLVANGDEDFEYAGVQVRGLYADTPAVLQRASSVSRLLRPIVSQLIALRLLVKLRPDVIHGHDPELLPLLMALRATGRQVVFDCHEDLGRQMQKKPYLGRFGPLVGKMLDKTLHLAASVLSTVVVAHTWQYPELPRRVVLRNLPSTRDLPAPRTELVPGAGLGLVYVGRVEENRGASKMLDLLQSLRDGGNDATLQLVGDITPTLLASLSDHPAWSHTHYHGPLPWADAMAVVAASDVGLFLPKRTPAYELSESTKVYEYLALGLPAVVTDMEIYRRLGDDNPELAMTILSAEEPQWPSADELVDLQRVAVKGTEAVRADFAWSTEEAKLLSLYRSFEAA